MNKFKDARSTGQKEENTMGKYEQDARLLLEYVGGKENIAAVSHCVSRMRFVLNDPAKADVAKIEALKSAKGTSPRQASSKSSSATRSTISTMISSRSPASTVSPRRLSRARPSRTRTPCKKL